jgi:pimeloyl-ACP methyl ester carboxylesterase
VSIVTRLDYASPVTGDDRVLLVMLPGAGIRAAEFATQGMVEAAHAQDVPVDVAVVEPDLALYLEDGVTAALHEHVVEPARERGYRRIWLLGISLGGMGALLYASAHPAQVEGLVLLAPFLGTRGTMAALAKAGGLGPEIRSLATTAPEQRLLGWLSGYLAQGASAPALYLGYARQDRFAPGHRLLAERLPLARTAVRDGGHDWPAWTALWRELLTRAPFRPPASGDSDCYKS